MRRLDFLLDKARPFYNNGDPGHDFVHIQRVVANCERIGSSVGANLELLLPAAVLHDIVNLPKNHSERLEASRMAAQKSEQILLESGFNALEIQQITQIITEHSYSLGKKPSSIESAVLQDADKLDALGAIGIMRAVTCGYRLGSSYYDSNEPFASFRELDDRVFTIDHFFTKLLKLPDLMNTEFAKKEAICRVEFMRSFLSQLKAEISGVVESDASD